MSIDWVNKKQRVVTNQNLNLLLLFIVCIKFLFCACNKIYLFIIKNFKLKFLCNKIQKCAQIILLHSEFYTLDPTTKIRCNKIFVETIGIDKIFFIV